MSIVPKSRRGSWPDLANVVIGCWFFLSPFFLLHYEEMVSSMNAYITGSAIAVFAAQAKEFPRAARTTVGIFALWLVASPWLLGFAVLTQTGTISAVVTGIAVLAFAAWAATGGRAPDAPQAA